MDMAVVQTTAIDELDVRLKAEYMEGHWITGTQEEVERTYTMNPFTKVKPYLWKGDTVFECLKRAGESRGLAAMSDRRTIRLVNPAFIDDTVRRNRTTCHTMQLCVQLLKHGENASSHRHNFGAFRFVLEGSGAYTVVDGEKFVMEPGDLILNPPMVWHGHGNDAGTIVWIDGLNFPLLHLLQTTMWEAYPGEIQNITPESDAIEHWLGHVRPVWAAKDREIGPLCYKWDAVYKTLRGLKSSSGDEFDAVALEYVNPLNGDHAFATMACWIQMLREGEKTRTHRHNHTTIYHAFRGSGTTMINGEAFHWKEGDFFIVPSWAWHSHANPSGDTEAILFSMNDMPTMEALKLHVSEAQ
jgi:gentisate 1,2-dioxygenase